MNERKPLTSMTDALAEALYLAIIAPTDEQSRRATDLAAPLWDQLTELEVQRAKKIAERRVAEEQEQESS